MLGVKDYAASRYGGKDKMEVRDGSERRARFALIPVSNVDGESVKNT